MNSKMNLSIIDLFSIAEMFRGDCDSFTSKMLDAAMDGIDPLDVSKQSIEDLDKKSSEEI